ncbi:MAG TPA: CoA transferase, partial [Amycolatopsis sp.]|nr:CoA transferase [Amycolatopsis sp.]
ALHERSRSGHGQHVRTSLLHGLAALGTYNWFLLVVAKQYPDAFQAVEKWDENGTPRHSLYFRLIIALTADGRWLQFSQTQPRLFDAFLRAVDLDWMKADPEWSTVPTFEDLDQRDRFWTMLLERIKAKTFAEWQEIFDEDPDVWAEVFRDGRELLDHPQLLHGNWVAELADPDVGTVRQPAALVRLEGTPARLGAPAPRLNEGANSVRPRPRPQPPAGAPDGRPPLEGVTLLELGTFFAAPYGGCVLADLGARVIKIEPLAGEPMRTLLDFPEAGAAKVLQGKESVALDMQTPEGLRVVHELAKRADIVLQTFRAGAAQRLGIDQETLRAINPDLVYLNAPGYGMDGPCGDKPAFAPTIAAGSGMGKRNAGPGVPQRPDLTIEEIKRYSRQLAPTVAAECAQPDGLAAVAVATAMLLGLVARDRGHGGQAMLTTMLSSAMHALSDEMVDYPNVPPTPVPDADLHGLSALYRLYETADGWVFLAAPTERDWTALTTELADHGGALARDPRFGTTGAREENDGALAEQLAKIFQTDAAEVWERRLLAVGVGCVRAADGPVEVQLQSDELGRASDILVDVQHPLFGEHPRLTPLASFSRSGAVAGTAPALGDHTDSVLGELGYDDAEIADLRERGVIG